MNWAYRFFFTGKTSGRVCKPILVAGALLVLWMASQLGNARVVF